MKPLRVVLALQICTNSLVGRHWSSVFQELRHRTENISECRKIILLENAIVLDFNRQDYRALRWLYEGSGI